MLKRLDAMTGGDSEARSDQNGRAIRNGWLVLELLAFAQRERLSEGVERNVEIVVAIGAFGEQCTRNECCGGSDVAVSIGVRYCRRHQRRRDKLSAA